MKTFIISDSILNPGQNIEYTVPAHWNVEQLCEALTLFLRSANYINNSQEIVISCYDDLK